MGGFLKQVVGLGLGAPFFRGSVSESVAAGSRSRPALPSKVRTHHAWPAKSPWGNRYGGHGGFHLFSKRRNPSFGFLFILFLCFFLLRQTEPAHKQRMPPKKKHPACTNKEQKPHVLRFCGDHEGRSSSIFLLKTASFDKTIKKTIGSANLKRYQSTSNNCHIVVTIVTNFKEIQKFD